MSLSITGFLFLGGYILRWWLANFGLDFGPEPTHLPVSKATTHFVEPLREDGGLDFYGAVNKEMSKGVTPENNTVVLLAKVSGHRICHESVRDEFCEKTGIKEIPEDSAKMIRYMDFLQKLKSELYDGDFGNVLDDWTARESFTQSNPWTDQQFPAYAAFLDRNEISLNLLREASKREAFYYPCIPTRGYRVLGTSYEMTTEFNDYYKILKASAMRNAGNGDIQRAFEDTIALRRLARLRASMPFFGDHAVATALDEIAAGLDRTIVQSVSAQRDTVENHHVELSKLKRVHDFERVLDLGERMFKIQLCELINHQPSYAQHFLSALAETVVESVNLRSANWSLVAYLINKRIDRQISIWKTRDAAKFAELEKEDLIGTLRDENDCRALLAFATGPSQKSFLWAKRLTSSTASQLDVYLAMEKRVRSSDAATRITFALTRFRNIEGVYPATLQALVPKYLEELPKDSINDKPFGYRREQDTFILYSYYHDGIDNKGNRKDGGKGSDYLFFEPPVSFKDFVREHPIDGDLVERARKLIANEKN